MGKSKFVSPSYAMQWMLLIIFSQLILLVHINTAKSESLCPETIESKCAEVKMEIRQDLTLERQAFDARMRINNGLSHIGLEDVAVDVSFTDVSGQTVLASSDPNNPDALFYIRISSLENISDVDGTGVVSPSSSAEIHWLIIPAPGAAQELETGILYQVGATLTYTIGGAPHFYDVKPDTIRVKPMPLLSLDYFLPVNVYGDDPFTTEIEPPIPFSLGVRLQNNGFGVARNLKIDSAQPKIKENDQGLLIGASIERLEIDDKPVGDSLLADFGDIEPGAVKMGRWIMTCSLSGEFQEFNAEFSHSDELGGELTSLMEAVNTHHLVQVVLVDIPGRDTIRDFLAQDDTSYRLYESEDIDTAPVVNQSSASSLQLEGQHGTQTHYALSVPVTTGFMYVQLPDPLNGQKVIAEMVRSDGKLIKEENIWLSKTQNPDHSWDYHINLFDANATDSYTVKYDDTASMPQPPVLQFIPDRTRVEGQQLSFIVEASDPDGTTPMLSAAPLPAGAVFTDNGDGTGIFDWTPAVGQAGRYELTFKASDGELEDTQRAVITITSTDDTDGDGMPDAWEMEHFGTLDRDGTGDFDGDGISDLNEYLNGTDPASSNAPTVPEIFSPQDKAEVLDLYPDLVIENSSDPDDDVITYDFELYLDEEMTDLVANLLNAPEENQQTTWSVDEALNDNTWYYWRVRATDGSGFSPWAYGSFFVNTENDPPGAFNISSPVAGSEVDTQTPTLEVTNSTDVDFDTIMYDFEVYADSDLNTLVASVSGIAEGENGTSSWAVGSPLDDNSWYFWRAIATDEHGAQTLTPPASFFVNTINDAPGAPVLLSPADDSEVTVCDLDLIVQNSIDPDGDELTYFFEIDKVNTFDSVFKQSSGEVIEKVETTSWSVADLDDNTNYFWRVKASDGYAESQWTLGSFFVNTANDLPSAPALKNPGEGAWVDTLTPELEVHASIDPDNDSLIYRFEVHANDTLTDLVVTAESDIPAWVVSPELMDNKWYYWRTQAEDEHGAASDWMNMASFFTDSNGVDDPPVIAMQEPAEDLFTNAGNILLKWEDSDPDSDAEITLYYDTDSSGEDGVFIVGELSEDPDGESDTWLWDISEHEEGTIYVYATITDGSSSSTNYCPGSITIDRTPPNVSASPAGGVYFSKQSVSLNADEAAKIYYTLDGTDPSTDSILYSAPIEMSDVTVVSFMAVDAAGNQSQTVTELYEIIIINGDLDHDGDVDLDDRTILWDALGTCEGDDGFVPEADYNDSGCITFKDYLKWIQYYWAFRLKEHCSSSLNGDLDHDDDVDHDDRTILWDALGTCEGDDGFVPEADYNDSGCITLKDYLKWIKYRALFDFCKTL